MSNAEEKNQPTSKNRKVKLDNLFLDPNNYRFIDQKDYVFVPDEAVMDPDIQRRSTAFLIGRNADEVSELTSSFLKNGWLPVDQIQVKEISNSKGKYLVVEGNRRVATLKNLQRRFQDSAIDLGNLNSSIFTGVPVVLYGSADSAHNKIIAGLGHITGKKRWPPINQARLLRSLIDDDGMSEDDVCQALGISKNELRSSLKTLVLCDLYRESDFGDQFTSNKYSLFRETIRNRSMNGWIGWVAEENRPANAENVDRLFNWLSQEDADDESGTPAIDPAINTARDIRELAKIIHDQRALRTLEETRLISEATFSSEVLVNDKLTDSLNKINQCAGVLFNYANRLQEDQVSDLQASLQKLNGVFTAAGKTPTLFGQRLERSPIRSERESHFSEFQIDQFKRFNGLEIKDLRRINLFVGPNNVGKTTILEAVHLLASQNDLDELLRMICRRGKVSGEPPAIWVKEQLQSEINLSGKFDSGDNNVYLAIKNRFQPEEVEDNTFYVTSLSVKAEYGETSQDAVTHLFQKGERITRQRSVNVLCPVVYSSPFIRHDTDFLVDLFNRSVEAKTKDEVIKFIREKLDSNFTNVDAVSNYEIKQFTRFLVDHNKFEQALDITQFGQGVQRIFHIGLMFAYARGGVVLIDELENAIHYSLLKPFTRFLQELARKFNTQVFLTSHSKECVDAFVENEFGLEDVSAYALRPEDGEIKTYRYPGEKLQQLLNVANVDLRGMEE